MKNLSCWLGSLTIARLFWGLCTVIGLEMSVSATEFSESSVPLVEMGLAAGAGPVGEVGVAAVSLVLFFRRRLTSFTA